ncbi:DNA polymerase III subunit chi [Candidatus Hepatobacter penaei]|uniref:DNA polymerase III subunit chi n=1 Tax=Candidatus Hepatobacter penaei TaxID=1274402 RepID=UPI0009E3A603|nr:DNA polymerase III subunit chi [Candidatus Hepatobacter penaei]TGW15282.1 hypothetical protein EIL50_01965 [bacterium NHP-B]
MISLYALLHRPWADFLFALALQSLRKKERLGILFAHQEMLQSFDKMLWSKQSGSFFPHGCEGDAFFEEHPLWLTTRADEVPAHYGLLVVAEAKLARPQDYAKCGYIFEAHQRASALAFWESLRDQSCTPDVWQETAHNTFDRCTTWPPSGA